MIARFDRKARICIELSRIFTLTPFIRFLGTYVRDQGSLTREEAIRKLTSFPAGILGLRDRGALVAGSIAEIVVLDPEKIKDNATFEDPFHLDNGMKYVFVNGTAAVDDGKYTRALPGRALRGPAFVEHEALQPN